MSLNISQIRTDGGTQSRAALNDETVAEYAEAMGDENAVFPPVIVYFDGRDYWLADGFHRIAAWEKIGRTEIPADVRQGDRRRAILHSVAANSAHGLRRTNADKRRAVMTLLEDDEWGAWSDREIARRCGVSHPFVASIRAGLSGNDYQMTETRTVERGGTTYTQNTTNIGATKTDPDCQPGSVEDAPQAVDPQPEDAECQPDPHAAERKKLSGLSREGLEDEVIGLREEIADQKKRIASQRGEIADLKARIKELTEGDAGRTIGNLQRRIAQAEGRSKEHQTNAARLQRQVNSQKAEIKRLRGELENQEIAL